MPTTNRGGKTRTSRTPSPTGADGPGKEAMVRRRIRTPGLPWPPARIPVIRRLADDPAGVPISAIIFGGRRRELAPLVYQAKNWRHGVLVGASVASETTAAATGEVGVTRRDPMAMKPFCGYNFADYWQHWLDFDGRSPRLPQIFHVNWFRQDGERQIPLAGIRREPAGPALDHRSLRRSRGRP